MVGTAGVSQLARPCSAVNFRQKSSIFQARGPLDLSNGTIFMWHGCPRRVCSAASSGPSPGSMHTAPVLAKIAARLFSTIRDSAMGAPYVPLAARTMNAASGVGRQSITFRKAPLVRPKSSLAKPCSIRCQNAQPKHEWDRGPREPGRKIPRQLPWTRFRLSGRRFPNV